MIVITGGTGFLGSSLVRRFVSDGNDIHVLTSSEKNLWRLSDFPNVGLTCVNPHEWSDAILDLKPESIVAADWSGVGNNSRNDKETQESNLKRHIQVATVARDLGVVQYINFGSQAELGPLNVVASREEKDAPITEYGKAKVKLRSELFDIFDKSETRFVWGRIFSTYGPTDLGPWLIPNLIRSFILKKSFKLTSGLQEWSYLYNSDFASAVSAIIENREIQGVVNIGNPEASRILDIAQIIAAEMNSETYLEIGEALIRDDQGKIMKPDMSELLSYGWSPKVELKTGLIETVRWGLENKDLILKS
jgi:nucleoside-diphosphate-sugar epimerase